jgi:flagellar biosynthetic protein FliO
MGALLQAGGEPISSGYGVALLQALFALAAVCLLAWVIVRWGARRGFGLGAGGRRVRVLERVPLDARRALYLVRVGDKVLLVGAGDTGAPAVLSEIDPDTVPTVETPDGSAFGAVLKRLRGEVGGPGS